MERNNFRSATKFNNIREIICNSAKVYADNIAFVIKKIKDEKTEYINVTYKEFLEDINNLGASLYNLGLKAKRVAIYGRNRYEWALSHFACCMGNMVSVPLDKELQEEELEESLIRSKAEAIVFDEKFEDKIQDIKRRGKTFLKTFICMGKLDGFKNIADLVKQGKGLDKDEYTSCNIDSEKMGMLLFTSGTTSKSKAVMLSQKGIAANVYSMQVVEDIRSTDTNIAFLPFHHIFGSTGMLMMLACGVKNVFPDGLRYIQKNLKEYGVTLFIGVPLLVDKMYQTVEKEIAKQNKTKLIKFAKKLSNLLLKFHIDIRRKLFKQVIDGLGGKIRFVISGGAPLDKATEQGFIDYGIKVVQGYGLTETSPVIAAENDNALKCGSVGIPMKDVELELYNKDENGIGEIRVKGPNVMLGYYENEEATKAVLKDGWFYTGDLAYIDEDGFIFLTGRSKDVIVLKNGKKVFPDELETLVNRLPEVEECIIFGMPDDDEPNNVKIALKVVYEAEWAEGKTEEEIHDIIWKKVKEINKTFPPYKYIKHLIVTDKPLIKTTTSKVKRKEEIASILAK